MRRSLVVALLALIALVSAATAASAADGGAEQRLAEKYAPVLGLKVEPEPCASTGEPYRPVPVETVLGRPDVRLVGSDGAVVMWSPKAADLFGMGRDYFLDFPANPLKPGCEYEDWFNRIAHGVATTSYAHIAQEQGKLALQYWFYYPFNDWNNKHESDWEMIQLVFDAPTADQALGMDPELVGYSQHEGAESATWGESKLEIRDGTHPVVYPGARSHANQFVPSLYLGHNAQSGFGCDDTRGPTKYEPSEVILVPTTATGPKDEFAWVNYLGHWGQKASGPNTGPTGPALKAQWTKPITWVDEEWRPEGVQVPAATSIAPSATGFFCQAVQRGSGVYLATLRNPWFVAAVLAAVVGLAVWLSRRTDWSPAPPRPIALQRKGGEIFNSAFKIYRESFPLFLGLGLIAVPLGILAAVLQNVLFGWTGLAALVEVALSDRLIGAFSALLFGGFTTLLTALFVYAACAEALDQIDAGGEPDVLSTYRALLPRVPALLWSTIRVAAVAMLLTVTVIGIPFAVLYLIRKTVTTQAITLEERGATSALRRSSELVTGRELRVFAIGAFINGAVALVGPLVGVLLMFLTSSSLGFINLASAAIYIVMLPAAGIAIALLFYSLRVEHEGDSSPYPLVNLPTPQTGTRQPTEPQESRA